MNDGSIPFETAILILRRKLFPFMHDPYPWVEGLCLRLVIKQEGVKLIINTTSDV
jgi:hypothetical protein